MKTEDRIMKTVDEFIRGVHVNEANLKSIAEHGRINGTLLVELRRILHEYNAQQTVDLKLRLKQAIETKQKTLLSPERYQGMQLVKDIIDAV
jgi:hypothetical protein